MLDERECQVWFIDILDILSLTTNFGFNCQAYIKLMSSWIILIPRPHLASLSPALSVT